MSFADSSSAVLSIKRETTFGTPETGDFNEFRFTGESLNYNIDTVESQEIRPDRQVPDLIRVNAGAGGDVEFEMSYGAFDEILEGLFLNAWSNEYKAVDVAGSLITASRQLTLTGENPGGSGLVGGQWIRVTTPTQSLYLLVESIVSDTITYAPTSETVQDETATMSISASRLTIGITKTLNQFTINKGFPDVNQYFQYNGQRCGSMALNIATEAIMTGTFTFEGLSSTNKATPYETSILPGPGNDVMSAVANVFNIRKDGVVKPFEIQTMTLNLANALRSQTAIGTLGAVGIGIGRAAVTGDVSAYFEDAQLFDDLRNGTEFSFDFRLQDTAGNAYVITMFRVKMASLEVTAGAIDQDVMADGTYQAILETDQTADVQNTIQIDRLPGVIV